MDHTYENQTPKKVKIDKPVIRSINQAFAVVDWAFEKLNVALMAFLVLSVIITVILRYVFDICFIWAEELILFTFIATTYFGIILCVKEDEHIAIDFLVLRLPTFFQKVLKTLISIIGIVTLLWIAKASLSWISIVGDTLSSGMKLPYKYVYSWMPFSFVVCSIYEVRKCIGYWIGGSVNKEVSS